MKRSMIIGKTLYNINICDFSNAFLNFINNSEMLFRSPRDNFVQKRLQLLFSHNSAKDFHLQKTSYPSR